MEKEGVERKVQLHGSLRKEAVATKDDNLRLHRQSQLPSPPWPDGKLVCCGIGHLCNSAFLCITCGYSVGPACLFATWG
jgi:hypothetical protein